MAKDYDDFEVGFRHGDAMGVRLLSPDVQAASFE